MGPDLMEEMRVQSERFGADVRSRRRHGARLGAPSVPDRRSARPSTSPDALILATGASAKWLDLGVDKQLSGTGVSTCATCDGFFFRGRDIAVVGGGDTAMEETIYLSKLVQSR